MHGKHKYWLQNLIIKYNLLTLSVKVDFVKYHSNHMMPAPVQYNGYGPTMQKSFYPPISGQKNFCYSWCQWIFL